MRPWAQAHKIPKITLNDSTKDLIKVQSLLEVGAVKYGQPKCQAE